MCAKKQHETPPPSNLPVTAVKGVGPRRAAILKRLGIETVADLLRHFPRSYHDRTQITRIADLKLGERATIQAEVLETDVTYLRRRMCLAKALLKDDSGTVWAAWFNQPYMTRVMKVGAKAFFTGEVIKYGGLQLRNPEYEFIPEAENDTIHTGRIVPIYPLTEGISQRQMRAIMWEAVESYADPCRETLPAGVLDRQGFPQLDVALRDCHFPKNVDDEQIARRRCAFEELFEIQLRVLSERNRAKRETNRFRMASDGRCLKKLKSTLPFELTQAQKRAVSRILADLSSEAVMNRLVQGDVGCGKTVVALHAIAAALDSDCQTAFMAPTEILAEQHYISLKRMLEPLGAEPAILIGGMSKRESDRVRSGLDSGKVRVVVGTHALIQESVSFSSLGLVIVDEQHRFGVLQRATLKEKGFNPHLLLMTATPIPRTLALTVYGAMDVSVIDEMPPGRESVETKCVPAGKEKEMYSLLREEVGNGRQVFIVYPVIEESAKLDVEALLSGYEEFSTTTLKDFRADLIHGRMRTDEKESVMKRFNAGEIDVLFSTTVIEVGIDVANATVMVVKDAHRFGLAQLHQLRGRVGRGADKAYCFLAGKPRTEDGMRRLEVMEMTCDGFVIAEEDMKIRGPGEIQGLRQSGVADLKIADLVRDMRLLELAREEAEKVLQTAPDLADAFPTTTAGETRIITA